ncbi:MAG: hypothetical protein ABSF53_05280 [Terracidiphilus sp.]|jgi:hypothetical protein
MLFRAHLLQVDPVVVGSIRYFLMLAQLPDDGRMEARSIVEGGHVGYLSVDSLREFFGRASVGDESVKKLESALSQNGPLLFIGVLDFDAPQLRELGFQTLASMVEIVALAKCQTLGGGAMAVDVHYPIRKDERQCANCTLAATSVIHGVPQCDEHAGRRIIDEFPEILGALLARKLRTG